eukprot:8501005-Prorocentrum_lima.AAC.1
MEEWLLYGVLEDGGSTLEVSDGGNNADGWATLSYHSETSCLKDSCNLKGVSQEADNDNTY